MKDHHLVKTIHELPKNLLSSLDRREAALWIHGSIGDFEPTEKFLAFLGLPWRMILVENINSQFIQSLESTANTNDPMTVKRGFIHVITVDPNQVELPERCLPVYGLSSEGDPPSNNFTEKFKRMAMLENLRRSLIRDLIIIYADEDATALELQDLWNSGFRAQLTFCTNTTSVAQKIRPLLSDFSGSAVVNVLSQELGQLFDDFLTNYYATYPEERRVIRVRNQRGEIATLDITDLDEPERPILDAYSLIEERDLVIVPPNQLSEEEFVEFFQNSQGSWRPYAAGLPWIREDQAIERLGTCLRRLDAAGPEENCIAFILSEPGAGGTTLARALSWHYAARGYPVLVAKAFPFDADPLQLNNFLNRIRLAINNRSDAQAGEESAELRSSAEPFDRESQNRYYETPWIIVFDRIHWEYRDTELRKFRNQLEKQGRPVCILTVSGPVRGLGYFDTAVFKEVADLNHVIDQDEVRALGTHLNQFLRYYGKTRKEWQWDSFYEDHTVRYLEGLATFWVALSFWIRGQYDLSESIQEWMYRTFKDTVPEGVVREAILEIAAISSERFPLPEGLLPHRHNEWPTTHLLSDHRSKLGSLGLVKISSKGVNYWALVHDVLGRFLLNALFYDVQSRERMGLDDARDPEHLRFLLLKRISLKSSLGEVQHRSFGEDFAAAIFKIDPDHGHSSFAMFWREVLASLDSMSASLRDTSRVFRHHSAVSRRRIAKLDEAIYGVTIDDRSALLKRAIADILYALESIEYVPGSESNLNLYNSLAHAYFDLATTEKARGTPKDQVDDLLQRGRDATQRAYHESPTNSFVIETYVRDLLETSTVFPHLAISNCITALGILFSTISSDEDSYRRAQLGQYADRAVSILSQRASEFDERVELQSDVGLLVRSWMILCEGVDRRSGIDLADIPRENILSALSLLAHAEERRNMQISRLRYDLTCAAHPFDFKTQVLLLEQLQGGDYRSTPQLRLEYAILLYQTGRAIEGEKVFRQLRRLWRESEHFVRVPKPSRWLRESSGGSNARIVQAIVGSDSGFRTMARVREFRNSLVPFRLEEFGYQRLRPGVRFSCRVSFSHNGPFLRPVPTRGD